LLNQREQQLQAPTLATRQRGNRCKLRVTIKPKRFEKRGVLPIGFSATASDCFTNPLPRIEFYAAAIRKDLQGRSGPDWRPEEALSRDDALYLFTGAGAYAVMDKAAGALKPGAAADITICADTAQFQVPEFNHNIMPTMVMSSMIDRVPLKALMYNVWTSQMISPERALAIGAISDIVPAAELADKVAALVQRLADSAKPAVLAVKEYGVNAQPIDMSKAVHFARSLHALVNSSSQLKRK
jgi:hypothetical protein